MEFFANKLGPIPTQIPSDAVDRTTTARQKLAAQPASAQPSRSAQAAQPQQQRTAAAPPPQPAPEPDKKKKKGWF